MGAFRFDRVVGSWAAGRGRLVPRKKAEQNTDANNIVKFPAQRVALAA